jgi:hypothetical protein
MPKRTGWDMYYHDARKSERLGLGYIVPNRELRIALYYDEKMLQKEHTVSKKYSYSFYTFIVERSSVDGFFRMRLVIIIDVAFCPFDTPILCDIHAV